MIFMQVANIVFEVMLGILTVLVAHFLLFGVVGVFFKKKYPKTDRKLKYGVIIPARNEEAVVGNLIDSVYKNQYPQDKLQVFVIAHNCTDRTAEIARARGATVYEYNNPDECTMGYAFRYLFDRIREDWGVSNYDGFFLFNADNILDQHYFEKMNDAFVACNGESVVTSFRNTKNFGSNIISALYGLYFMIGCRYESRGRTVVGCSTRVQGTGYVINSRIVENGWPYVTLTEDWEFTADQILQNNKIVYCDDAVFYDEQPTGFRVMWRQRLRWSKGHLLVFLTRFRDTVKSLFTPKKKGGGIHKFSTYDIMVNIMPICVLSGSIFILRLLVHLIAPLFDLGRSPWDIWLEALQSAVPGLLFSYGMTALSAALIFILEHKRIKHVKLPLKILAVILWPAFIFLSTPIEFVALFSKNVGWKTIPHTDTTTFEKLNDKAHAGGEHAAEPQEEPAEKV